MNHPKKIGFAIAVIFGAGALLAHYHFSASIGWPIGLAAGGVVLGGVTAYRLHHAHLSAVKPQEPEANESFKRLWGDINMLGATINGLKAKEAMQHLSAEVLERSVPQHYQYECSFLWFAIKKMIENGADRDANVAPDWIALIRKMDELAPALKDKKNPGRVAFRDPSTGARTYQQEFGTDMTPREMVATSTNSQVRDIFNPFPA